SLKEMRDVVSLKTEREKYELFFTATLIVMVKTINDEVQIQALIDEKRVNIKESSIRHTLKLDDAEGTSCLTNAEIFDGLAKMGYEKLSEKLTFYKAFFSPQWKFVCANHQLGAGFSGVVTALFNTMLVPAAKEVGLIQANVQLTTIPTEPSTSTPHKKHKSKKQKPQATKVPSPEPSPEHRLPSPSNDPIPARQDSMQLKELMDLCTCLSNKILELESEIIDIKSSSKERIKKLEGRVAKLEEENRVFKELHSKADTAAHVVDKEKSFKQWRIIAEIDEDVEINLKEARAKLYKINLEHPEKVLSMQDVDEEEPAEVEEVLEVVKATKLMIEVVATTTAKAPKVSVIRRRRGVIIQDPEETTSIVVMHSKVQPKDKGKEEVNEEVTLPKKEVEVEAHKEKVKVLKRRIMFEKPDVEASVWRDQKGRYGLAKRYPLTHFTLEQMLNNVRLKVKEVSEISLELLRLVRRQLIEGYVPA
nr:hypothetical protein [Tanacetum cinerariifolium]